MLTKQDAINYFIETVDWNKVAKRWAIPNIVNLFEKEEFKQYWRQHPELRPGQVLVNLGLITDGQYQWEDGYLLLLAKCRKGIK